MHGDDHLSVMNRLVGAQLKESADLFVEQSILLFDVSYDKQQQSSKANIPKHCGVIKRKGNEKSII